MLYSSWSIIEDVGKTTGVNAPERISRIAHVEIWTIFRELKRWSKVELDWQWIDQWQRECAGKCCWRKSDLGDKTATRLRVKCKAPSPTAASAA